MSSCIHKLVLALSLLQSCASNNGILSEPRSPMVYGTVSTFFRVDNFREINMPKRRVDRSGPNKWYLQCKRYQSSATTALWYRFYTRCDYVWFKIANNTQAPSKWLILVGNYFLDKVPKSSLQSLHVIYLPVPKCFWVSTLSGDWAAWYCLHGGWTWRKTMN